MNITTGLILVFASSVSLFGCGKTNPQTTDAASADSASIVDPCPSLEGSWELISIDEASPALGGQFETDPEYQVAPTLKILNKDHWMFIRQSSEKFIHAQGGRYTLHDGIYTEMVDYSALPQNVGLDFVFECRLVGDSLWYHTGGLGDNRYEEIWRRVK